MRIRILIEHLNLEAELNDSPTAKKVGAVLPLKANFDTWGDEIYFGIPVDAESDETARREVQVGDIAYWPAGKAFCLFFGPTPMSTSGKIVPAGAVNLIGRITGDATRLKEVMHAAEVLVEPA